MIFISESSELDVFRQITFLRSVEEQKNAYLPSDDILVATVLYCNRQVPHLILPPESCVWQICSWQISSCSARSL